VEQAGLEGKAGTAVKEIRVGRVEVDALVSAGTSPPDQMANPVRMAQTGKRVRLEIREALVTIVS